MELVAAADSDIEQIRNTIGEITLWLKSKGIHPWTAAFPRSWIEGEIANGELFVYREHGVVVASTVLSFKAGEMWGQSEGAAMYVHRLAVKRECSGRKLGRAMMGWVEMEVRRRGVPLLRLECDSRNEVLQAYYASLGFQPKGIVHNSAYKMDFARFEKQIV